MFEPFTRFDSKKRISSEKVPMPWVEDHFGPTTAVVVETILGQTDKLGSIKYYGGCYARATSYEPVVLPAGLRVRVLGRIPSMNIWVVASLDASSLDASPSQNSSVPNPSWADSYIRKSSRVVNYAGKRM